MLTRRILEMSLVAAFAAYLTAMIFVFSSSEQPCPETNKQRCQDRAQETSTDQQDKSFRHWITHDAAGFFTLWLVIVGGCQLALFWVQLKYIRESLNDAAAAADAAKNSADLAREEFNATQRAKLVVRELLKLPRHIERASVEVRYVVANVGGSEAEIVESWIEIQNVQDGILWPLQPTEGANPIGKVIIEAGRHIFLEQNSTVSHASLGIGQIGARRHQRDEPELFFRGFILYEDRNHIKRRTAFCRRYDFKARRFRIVDDPDDEYAD